MTNPGFFVLELRRLLAALFAAGAVWLATQDWKLALVALVLVLAIAGLLFFQVPSPRG